MFYQISVPLRCCVIMQMLFHAKFCCSHLTELRARRTPDPVYFSADGWKHLHWRESEAGKMLNFSSSWGHHAKGSSSTQVQLDLWPASIVSWQHNWLYGGQCKWRLISVCFLVFHIHIYKCILVEWNWHRIALHLQFSNWIEWGRVRVDSCNFMP